MPFCSRARLALGLKNLPFEIIVVMEDDAETPRAWSARRPCRSSATSSCGRFCVR
ncbi:glutathione S-transferase N-terminal domain-containing protein [Massilia timonae]|uniref:glutathione S-transferase N-terminal domain-containing protein n=1 Tax=Massilia timonae TaxID=47229 RepID=UPI00351D4695